MNACQFYGMVVEGPTIDKNEDGVDVVNLTLSVDTFRKAKNGTKIRERNYLPMRAWDTAATTISKHCKKGDFLSVGTKARSEDGKVIFRINEFRIVGPSVDGTADS